MRRGRLDGANALQLPIFEDLEVLGSEAVDGLARLVGYDDVKHHQANIDAQRWTISRNGGLGAADVFWRLQWSRRRRLRAESIPSSNRRNGSDQQHARQEPEIAAKAMAMDDRQMQML